ncbi:hypothetical protein [Pararhodobacter oceanensis]|uniref:hypothetical protein n=1 Tax=Pararhodobacter oceanensis TaxID=2172121 RepID=UPI003A90E9B4
MMNLLELIGDAVMEREELLEDIARIDAEIAARSAAFFAQFGKGSAANASDPQDATAQIIPLPTATARP